MLWAELVRDGVGVDVEHARTVRCSIGAHHGAERELANALPVLKSDEPRRRHPHGLAPVRASSAMPRKSGTRPREGCSRPVARDGEVELSVVRP